MIHEIQGTPDLAIPQEITGNVEKYTPIEVRIKNVINEYIQFKKAYYTQSLVKARSLEQSFRNMEYLEVLSSSHDVDICRYFVNKSINNGESNSAINTLAKEVQKLHKDKFLVRKIGGYEIQNFIDSVQELIDNFDHIELDRRYTEFNNLYSPRDFLHN